MAKKKLKPFEPKAIRLDRKMQRSKALWSLRNNGLAILYLLELLARRQMHHDKVTGDWIIRNNGEIVFTYAEAMRKYGIHAPTHLNNLRRLHEVGFIDVSHYGGGMEGDCTRFSISQRWKRYGTPEFDAREWTRDTRKKGNPNIKRYGKGRNNG